MNQDSLIYVAGHRGLVGSALIRRLTVGGYTNLITRSHAELDLTQQAEVEHFFQNERPGFVFVAAAKVGGIKANDTYSADFLYTNLAIETNVIHAAHRYGVRKLLFLGSSCIYPKHAPQPMKEEHLLTGSLEPTNEAYAIAKIAGIRLCAAYNKQYGTNFISAMPTNLYGPGDNYDLENSHVIPALIRKFHDAKVKGLAEVAVWGTGTPRREFLFSDDLADACVFLMEKKSAVEIGEFINIGVGKDMQIHEAATIISDIVGYRGRIVFDHSRPDGTPRKLLDVSRMQALGWNSQTSFREGLKIAYADFQHNHRLHLDYVAQDLPARAQG